MVLAFSITDYDNETHTQSDLILTQDKEGFKLAHRIGFVPYSEEYFKEEDEAFKAFEEEEERKSKCEE